MGPLSRPDLLDNVLKQIKKGIQNGGQIIHGGLKLNDENLKKGNFLSPTIIEVDKKNPLFFEDIFGPVLTLTKFS